MIHDLPKESRYTTLVLWRKKNGKVSEEASESEGPDEELLERWEMRQWGDLSHELAAGQLNVLNNLLRFVPNWKKTPEEHPVVGPREWWPDEQLRAHDKKARKELKKSDEGGPSVSDVMGVFGYSGPS